MAAKAGGIQPATRRVMCSVSSKGWSRGSTSVVSEGACANSQDCRRAFRSLRGQGAAKLRTDPSPNVGPIGRPCGRVRRRGAISPGSAFFHRRSSRRLPRLACCGRARPAARGSLISTGRVSLPTSTFAGRPTKARSPAAPSPSSVCPHRLNSSHGSFSLRPRLTL